MAELSNDDKALLKRIDEWFEAHRQNIIEDIERLVRIPSVSKPPKEDNFDKEAPFGIECRKAMDEMLAIGREHGFHTENREYYVGTIGLQNKNYENTIGFWNHLDVVPVGEGWTRPPFEPYINDGFLIGRGVQDNKGPAIGMIYLMQCIRELGIEMKHELCLFVGCDEERGMEDIEYYTSKYKTPAISLIADSGFPVCYGEKGIIEGQFLSENELIEPLQCVWGGSAGNMIPDRAYARLTYSKELLDKLEKLAKAADNNNKVDTDNVSGNKSNTNKADTDNVSVNNSNANKADIDNISVNNGNMNKADIDNVSNNNADNKVCVESGIIIKTDDKSYIEVTACGTSRHSAFPDGSVNAIHELAQFLLQVEELGDKNLRVLSELCDVSSEYYGKTEGIAFTDEVSGHTTCAATVLSMEDGRMCVNLNIRYAITQNSEQIEKNLEKYASEHELIWRLERDSKPNYFPKENPAVDYLTKLYNEWQGLDTEAFVMGGGTYARKLPRAFAYGIGGMPRTAEDKEREARLFKKGSGGAHEPDEGLNLRMYFEAMKFYTLAVVGVDKLDLGK